MPRVWKLPLTQRQAVAFMRAAKAANFRSIRFEFSNGVKVVASDRVDDDEPKNELDKWLDAHPVERH